MQVLNHAEENLTVLHFDSGAQIETTAEHPFYVDGKGWVAAGQLGIGTSIVTRAGPSASFLAAFDAQAARVVRVEHRAQRGYVYNLIIAGSHTYFVGDGNDAHGYQWVHNGCGADQLHHLFPQAFKAFFKKRGIAINKYTVKLGEHLHLSGIHRRGGLPFPNGWPGTTPGYFNAAWRAFIKENPSATTQEVYHFAGQLMEQYGLNRLPIVPYK